ncbi:alpha/beta hydrolase [Telluribacter sp.]|jgi:pimeloyl-ACP methyl ester carboxylesterase|uniref:alpha/beta fold hydrolase n=1 Tax=Telluribacter sp. TaxID=1978767 RepID=UPI002E10829B|nr:alpha/beta hydrolase [Telluribacter sp.]
MVKKPTIKLSLLAAFVLLSLNAFPQKRFIPIDGTNIWINTIGLENRKEGQPVVVFESGYGTPMDQWDRLLEGASGLAPLITYDRPGIGESAPDQELPTIKNVADKLLEVLNHLQIKPPYVLVGHSLGGMYVRGFARYYPQVLAGLVIIDPADFTETRQNKRDYYKPLGWDEARIDKTVLEIEAGLTNRNKEAPQSIREEGEVLADLRKTEFKEITEHALPNIPVHIITGGRFDAPEASRTKENEAVFRSKMRIRVGRWMDVVQSVDKGMLLYSGDAGHFVHYDDPELVVSSIRLVLQDYELLRQKKEK